MTIVTVMRLCYMSWLTQGVQQPLSADRIRKSEVFTDGSRFDGCFCFWGNVAGAEHLLVARPHIKLRRVEPPLNAFRQYRNPDDDEHRHPQNEQEAIAIAVFVRHRLVTLPADV